MSINNEVMINAIKHELNTKKRTSRLLPKNIGKALYNVLVDKGYSVVEKGVLVSSTTKAIFKQTFHNRIKVQFEALV